MLKVSSVTKRTTSGDTTNILPVSNCAKNVATKILSANNSSTNVTNICPKKDDVTHGTSGSVCKKRYIQLTLEETSVMYKAKKEADDIWSMINVGSDVSKNSYKNIRWLIMRLYRDKDEKGSLSTRADFDR